MTKEERRRQVIQACMAQQRQVAAMAEQEMNSAQQQSNDYGAAVDRYDSYRTKMMRQRDMYARQLSNANAALRALDTLLRLPPPSRAEHGSIVVTDRQRFFLSVGIGKFPVPAEKAERAAPAAPAEEVEEAPQTYFAISTQVPIFLALKGLTEGDSFIFNGVRQTIKEIF